MKQGVSNSMSQYGNDTCVKAIHTDAKSYTHALKWGVGNGMSQCDSDTCDKAIQTDTKSYTHTLKWGVSEWYVPVW